MQVWLYFLDRRLNIFYLCNMDETHVHHPLLYKISPIYSLKLNLSKSIYSHEKYIVII